ncbi:4'-phosphopantetheinyl transferase family protein [Streptomyces sp. NRRL WC-3742]|uniref:4'-phosphopantetheinyl transferase family protein n=1 Tax=Streptomyces sp. NRRL WC-3742 TaxID=1463934 RepID=UPI0006916997|nr:4'-phosphopantetheinyl transferase superfamily protein [Streptomyces sp. NRRL WC-3742]
MTAVDLWLIDCRQPEPVVAELWHSLDERERDRAARANPEVRRRLTVTRGAVRQLVAVRLGLRPTEVRWRYGPHGKPEPEGAAGLRVSWTGSDDLAALALAEGERAVGVDVERAADARAAERLARRCFPPEEARFVAEGPTPEERSARFTALWCRREACVKAYGGRLAQSFALPVAGPSPLVLPCAGALGPGPVLLRDVSVPGAFHGALALLGAAPVHVNSRSWQVN